MAHLGFPAAKIDHRSCAVQQDSVSLIQALKSPVYSAGLCPGLNDVVQGIVRKLEDYGVPEGNILGIK